MTADRRVVLLALAASAALTAPAAAQAPPGPPGPPPGNGPDLPASPGTAPPFVAARQRPERSPTRAARVC